MSARKSAPFHVRRLVFPDGKGWIALQGTFNPFELSEEQRRLLGQMVDLFAQFEKTFTPLPEGPLVCARCGQEIPEGFHHQEPVYGDTYDGPRDGICFEIHSVSGCLHREIKPAPADGQAASGGNKA